MPWPGPFPIPGSTTQSFFLRGFDRSTSAIWLSPGWLAPSIAAALSGSAVFAEKRTLWRMVSPAMKSRQGGVSPAAVVPAAPVDPTLPAAPVPPAPVTPAAPVDPTLPAAPVDPTLPAAPVDPTLPAAPVVPAA